jgi:DNA-binding MarR family transcriptional regulator
MLVTPTIFAGDTVNPTPPLTQSIGQTAGTLRRLVKRVLADTDTTYEQWMALNLAASSGGIDRHQLSARLADAVQIESAAAAATVRELSAAGFLETEPRRPVGLSDTGRDRHARIRGVLDKATAPLSADLPVDDLAAARRVLAAISQRADAVSRRREQREPVHSSAQDNPTESQRRLQELIDRNEITELVSRLGMWLDEKRWDEARSILTEDATAETGGGSVAGVEQVAEQARRNHVVPTHHVITNVLIDLDGDRATVSANLVATFVGGTDGSGPHSQLGERYRFEAVRSSEGWRLSRVEARPVWSVRSDARRSSP